MTTLAHNAAVLGVPVDTALLFGGDDLYTLWIDQVVDRVANTRDAEGRRLEAEAQRYSEDED